MKYLFAVLIPIALLLGCEKETLTQPTEPSPLPEEKIWKKLCDTGEFPGKCFITALSYDEIWACDYESYSFLGLAIVGKYQNQIWTYYNYNPSHEAGTKCIKAQPDTGNIWLTLQDNTSPTNSGLYKYDPNQTGFPFIQVIQCQNPGQIDFLDANTGVMVSRYLSQIWTYEDGSWTLHQVSIPTTPIIDSISICRNPDIVVYMICETQETVYRWSNDQLTDYGYIYSINPWDIYALDDDNVFVATRIGLQRKSGDFWYRDTSFPGQDTYSVDGYNGVVWILGKQWSNDNAMIWRYEGGEYSSESVDFTSADWNTNRIEMLHNNQIPQQGLVGDIYARYAE